MGELRAGMRWYAGTDYGGRYQALLAHLGEGDYSVPKPYERTIGDLVDPTRAGRISAVVNAVSRDVGLDAAGWRVDRLLGMMAQIANRPQPEMPE